MGILSVGVLWVVMQTLRPCAKINPRTGYSVCIQGWNNDPEPDIPNFWADPKLPEPHCIYNPDGSMWCNGRIWEALPTKAAPPVLRDDCWDYADNPNRARCAFREKLVAICEDQVANSDDSTCQTEDCRTKWRLFKFGVSVGCKGMSGLLP